MIVKDWEIWIKFMYINLDLGEVQHSNYFFRNKSLLYYLFNSLTFKLKKLESNDLSCF